MIRKAVPADAAPLEAFLAKHAASSMFLRGNLAQHGTQDHTHRHGGTYWLHEVDGAITAVAGATNGGYLMCQAPAAPAGFWQAVCAQMQGRTLGGITGEPAQTAAWIAALGWQPQDFTLNQITPLFEVATSKVEPVPEGLSLRRPRAADAAMLSDWFTGFFNDTGLGFPVGVTGPSAAEGFIAQDDTQILVAEGHPVAMTAINARAVDTVQVGGVYVPPSERGKGYGGAVVALHLQALRHEGIDNAILFAANQAAARAYLRIGFREVGAYRVAMLKSPLVVGAGAHD